LLVCRVRTQEQVEEADDRIHSNHCLRLFIPLPEKKSNPPIFFLFQSIPFTNRLTSHHFANFKYKGHAHHIDIGSQATAKIVLVEALFSTFARVLPLSRSIVDRFAFIRLLDALLVCNYLSFTAHLARSFQNKRSLFNIPPTVFAVVRFASIDRRFLFPIVPFHL
jgi:hypothetical protein